VLIYSQLHHVNRVLRKQ